MLMNYPLQTKKVRMLHLPWFHLGICEVMNAMPEYNGATFAFSNHHNVSTSQPGSRNESSGGAATVGCGGQTVGAGVFDSYRESLCSRFVASSLQHIFSRHVSDLTSQRQLLRRLPQDDPMSGALETLLALRRLRPSNASPKTDQSIAHFVSQEEMIQYAQAVDAAFLNLCRSQQQGNVSGQGSNLDQVGCRGAWFASTLRWEGGQQQGSLQNTFVDVCAANVGNCRTFVVARNSATSALHSKLLPTRWRVLPLSMDHILHREEEFGRITLAGGVIDAETHSLIDGNPQMNVSRAFGYWCMKNNPKLPASRQKLISQPSVVPSTRLHGGDIIVCMNFGAFETRSGDISTVDEIADVAVRALAEGGTAADAAGAICDHAITFGANHSLQVAVGVVPSDLNTLHVHDAKAMATAAVTKTVVIPGALYPSACQTSKMRLDAFLVDVERCEVTLEEWLQLRYEALCPLLQASRSQVLRPFRQSYPRECNMLDQIIKDEAAFFGNGPHVGDAAGTQTYFGQLVHKLIPR
jgi:hypothetical protein